MGRAGQHRPAAGRPQPRDTRAPVGTNRGRGRRSTGAEAAGHQDARPLLRRIAKHYEPEQLGGKQVCFIANLPPREFKNGLVSEGVILSAVNHDGALSVVTVDREVLPGSEVG